MGRAGGAVPVHGGQQGGAGGPAGVGLVGRAVSFPYHRALVSELYGFEYGKSGPSGRAKTGARPGGHDDCVMALALAWWAAPEAAPAPPSELILLGSSVGMGLREAF